MTRTPGQIAYEAAKPLMGGSPIDWNNPRFDPDAKEKWEAAASAVIEMCIKETCRECRRGDEPRYDAEVRYYYHDVAEGAELGCFASHLRALKDVPHG